jgi:hypothetical protein
VAGAYLESHLDTVIYMRLLRAWRMGWHQRGAADQGPLWFEAVGTLGKHLTEIVVVGLVFHRCHSTPVFIKGESRVYLGLYTLTISCYQQIEDCKAFEPS